MSAFRTIDDLTDVSGKRVLVRVDLNVPIENGAISDTTRIERILPIRALQIGAAVLFAALGLWVAAQTAGWVG